MPRPSVQAYTSAGVTSRAVIRIRRRKHHGPRTDAAERADGCFVESALHGRGADQDLRPPGVDDVRQPGAALGAGRAAGREPSGRLRLDAHG